MDIKICNPIQGGSFALMGAAKEGQTEIVIELVKAGANINVENNVGNCIDSLQEIYDCNYLCLHILCIQLGIDGGS